MPTIDLLETALQAGIPTIIWGPPGVGKTATVYELARRLDLHLEVVIASLHEPSDFNGLPIRVNASVEMAPPAWAVRLKEAGRGEGSSFLSLLCSPNG